MDPSWVRPLAALRTRGVACVVVTVDASAYGRFEIETRAALTGISAPPDTSREEAVAKRRRAIRHALAEYELPTHTIIPDRPLGEILIS
jgi:hypothetical protein